MAGFVLDRRRADVVRANLVWRARLRRGGKHHGKGRRDQYSHCAVQMERLSTEGFLNALQKAGSNGLTVSKNLQEMTSASVQASERYLSMKAEQSSLETEVDANKKALSQVSSAYDDLQSAYNNGVLYALPVQRPLKPRTVKRALPDDARSAVIQPCPCCAAYPKARIKRFRARNSRLFFILSRSAVT
jgi:hypothetical protein